MTRHCTGKALLVYQTVHDTPLVQERLFWCTKQSMTRHWYRKGSSGVLTKVRMPSSAPERKPWPNNGQSQASRMLDPNIPIEAFLLPDYILQNAFSNITYLCPQRPDMAEKLKAKRPPFSRQCVSPTLLSNIGMKAFRKSVF